MISQLFVSDVFLFGFRDATYDVIEEAREVLKKLPDADGNKFKS